MNRKTKTLLALAVLLVIGTGCVEAVASGKIIAATKTPGPTLEFEPDQLEEMVAQVPPEELVLETATPSATEIVISIPLQFPTATFVVADTLTSLPIILSVSTPTIVPQPTNVSTETPTSIPTSSAPGGPEKKIVVDLSDQVLYAYEGEKPVFSARVSTGLTYLTPVGTYRIYVKILKYKMEGGSEEEGTYYYLKNVPHVQYFWKGYGLHGAYWHNNFGHPMSHGCVNLSLPDAEWLFNWTDPILPPETKVVYATEDHPGTLVIVQE